MASTASYASVPKSAQVQITTINTARDWSWTLWTLVIWATNWTRVDDIYITAAVTTTAWMLRMFINDWTTTRLLQEIPVTAVTPSWTVPVWSTYLSNLWIILQSWWNLKFGADKAEAFNIVMTRGWDL